MGHDATYKLGLIVQMQQEKSALQTKVRSYRESINHLFYKYPFDLHLIDVDAVRSLSGELIKCLEQYRKLQAEIEDLEG
jgi:hypothetical protein